MAEPVRPIRRSELERASLVAEPVRRTPGSFRATVVWLGAVLLLGVLAVPIVFRLFPLMSERGLGLAKTVGLVVPTLVVTALLKTGGFGEPRRTAFLALVITAACSAACAWGVRTEVFRFVRERSRLVLAGELVFFLGFGLFLGLRALNPEITWGEKPMDLSLLNVLVRARSLPVSDPWLAGAPLGYYTFGHQAMGVPDPRDGPAHAAHLQPRVRSARRAVAQGAFSLAAAWGGRIRAGLAGAAFVGLLGNLSGLWEWIVLRRPKGLPLDWHYFWATSRVIKDTINEYPFWGLVFADLHAHVLAVPFFLLLAAAALELVRAHAGGGAALLRRLGAAIALGIALAVQALTNAWDIPFLAGLLVLTGLVAALSGDGTARSTARGLSSAVAAGVTAWAVFSALRWEGAQRPGYGWNGEAPASLRDVLLVFGLFFFVAFAWWFAWDRDDRRGAGNVRSPLLAAGVVAALILSLTLQSVALLCVAGVAAFVATVFADRQDPSVRLAAGFVAAGFFLVLFTQYFYISDRMNTFFKLYLEAWLALSVGTAVLAFGSVGRPGTVSTWPRAVRGLLGLLVGAALFTTLTGARGAIGDARPTFRAGAPRPTLDGLAYLDGTRPGELAAVEWLQAAVQGTPVLLEAQGPSYQEFSRISMMTGIPTVLGWEYHVNQRGNARAEIEARRAAVSRIYSSRAADVVEPLLRRYRVGYVYVGWLERATYPPAGLSKFATAGELFEEVFAYKDVRIYRVLGAGAVSAAPLPLPAAADAGGGRGARGGPAGRGAGGAAGLSQLSAPGLGPVREPQGTSCRGRRRPGAALGDGLRQLAAPGLRRGRRPPRGVGRARLGALRTPRADRHFDFRGPGPDRRHVERASGSVRRRRRMEGVRGGILRATRGRARSGWPDLGRGHRQPQGSRLRRSREAREDGRRQGVGAASVLESGRDCRGSLGAGLRRGHRERAHPGAGSLRVVPFGHSRLSVDGADRAADRRRRDGTALRRQPVDRRGPRVRRRGNPPLVTGSGRRWPEARPPCRNRRRRGPQVPLGGERGERLRDEPFADSPGEVTRAGGNPLAGSCEPYFEDELARTRGAAKKTGRP